jgi:F-type H+-transporting ATPase subunit a
MLSSFIIAQGHPPAEVAQAAGAVVEAAQTAGEGFKPGEMILEHVSNSSIDHPLIHLPHVFGIDMSVTKHVFMLWVVATVLFVTVTMLVRRYIRQARLVPTGTMGVLEVGVEFVQENIVAPNVGRKWAPTWTPLVLSQLLFILLANGIGLVPVFDVLALLDRYVIHSGDGSFLQRLVHGGPTATANFNVTAGLAMITFFATIVAGTRVHGFLTHWKNLVPPGLPKPLYILLIPMEILGMLVRPFALTMRLAANMTGGHIAILAILSFVFIFTGMLESAAGGIGLGMVFSVPLAAAISGLEIIVVLVQAYVFALLSAVFIGMAIHAHH